MDCDMDIVVAAGGLSNFCAAPDVAGNKLGCALHSCIDRHPNAHPAHAYPYTNTNAYANTFIYIHSRTGWLCKAAGGLHAR